MEGVRDWWFKFQVLFNRTLQTYTRSPANVVARFIANQSMGLVLGTLFADLGRIHGLLGFTNMTGGSKENGLWTRDGMLKRKCSITHPFVNTYTVDIFLCMVAQEVSPFFSVPLYAHHRAFYVVENAANLYPTSCYYLAIILMELVLNAVSVGLLAAQMYYFHNIAAYFQPKRPWTACAGYAGFMMLLNAATNVRMGRTLLLTSYTCSCALFRFHATGTDDILQHGHIQPAGCFCQRGVCKLDDGTHVWGRLAHKPYAGAVQGAGPPILL